MESQLQLFEQIWTAWCNMLPIDDKYMKIISKIRKNDMDFSICKKEFIDLIDIMSLTIYKYKYGDDGEGEANDKELNCCHNIKTYLVNYVKV